MDSHDDKSNDSLVEVLTQLDISDQSHRRISGLPNEMLRAILSRVQLPHVIRFRSVDKRWKVTIEDICLEKKCLMVTDYGNNHYFVNTLSNRFNGYFKLNHDFVFIQIKSYELDRKIIFSANLCPILAKLFPKIEQFFTKVDFLYYSPEFISMLQKWSSTLITLSFPSIYNFNAQINNLPKLQQLNLETFNRETVNQLACWYAPTFARLGHFSFHGNESITKIVPLLGTRCTSLAISRPSLFIEAITNWRNVNAQFVSNLERFTLVTTDPQVFPFICKHFSSLRILRMDFTTDNQSECKFTTDTIQLLARLAHLAELRFDSVVIDLASFDLTNLRPLANIRILSLINFVFVQRNYDAHHFGRILSTIFPNVNKLAIKSYFYKMLEDSLEPHVKLFTKLRSYDFSFGDPNDSLMN